MEKLRQYIIDKQLILLFSFASFIIIIGFFSILNRAQWNEPELGLEMTMDKSGFVHIKPLQNSQAANAGVQEGDTLLQLEGIQFFSDGSSKKIHWLLNDRFKIVTTIIYKGKSLDQWVEKIDDPEGIEKIGFLLGKNTSIRLIIHRGNKPPREISYALPLVRPKHQFEYFFFSFVGAITLIIGLIVLAAKKPNVKGRIVFFFFTLSLFVLLVYSYTSDDDPFGRFIFYSDILCRILFAPLFLHFIFLITGILKNNKYILYVVYLPAIGLLTLEALIFTYNILFNPNSKFVNIFNIEFLQLQNIELITMSAYIFVAFITALVKYIKTSNIIVKKQMKFILVGIVVGCFPITILYFSFYLSGIQNTLISLPAGILFLVFPLSLSYSTVRYKLMDIELQLLRAIGYALSFAALLIFYFISIFFILSLFHEYETEALIITLALFTLLLAIIYEPLHRRIRNFLDTILYRDSYDFRKTLGSFSREFSTEHNIQKLLTSIVQRLSRAFTISRSSAFIYDEKSRAFKLVAVYPEEKSKKSVPEKKHFPLKNKNAFSKVFSDHIFLRKNPERIITYEQMKAIREEFHGDSDLINEQKASYIIPLFHRGKIPALLTLSLKANGELLTSEDIELLNIIRMPAAIACENALLFEIVKNESALNRELLEFNNSVLESMQGGVVVVDKKLKIRQTNKRFTQIFNLDQDIIKRKKLSVVLPRDFANTLLAQIDRTVISEGKDYHIFKLPYNIGKSQQFFNVSLSPFMKNDKYAGHVMLFDNITEQVLIEDHLYRSDKLASLGMLAAGMAHEVNTPLTGISSYVQMLIKELQAQQKPSEILKKIDRQTIRIKNLVNRLLNFSKPGEGKYSNVSLNEIITDIYELFGKQMEKTGVRFQLDLLKELPAIYGDYWKLQQLLTNLLINARDAVGTDGLIRISTSADETGVFITMQDSGVGINEENLMKIYDPFFTTKKEAGGTGLGLSICSGIIREHLGTISVRSMPGKGTTFVIRLPLIKKGDIK